MNEYNRHEGLEAERRVCTNLGYSYAELSHSKGIDLKIENMEIKSARTWIKRGNNGYRHGRIFFKPYDLKTKGKSAIIHKLNSKEKPIWDLKSYELLIIPNTLIISYLMEKNRWKGNGAIYKIAINILVKIAKDSIKNKNEVNQNGKTRN